MELVLAILIVFLLAGIFAVGFLVGSRQVVNKIKQDGGYFDTEITQSVYPYRTSSVADEVPTELLMGGDIDRALYIAGVKEASIDKQVEWAEKRKAEQDAKQEENEARLKEYLELKNEELLIKAGIKVSPVTPEGVEIAKNLTKETPPAIKEAFANAKTLADIATPKGYDPLKEEAIKRERARKETDMWLEEKVKSDFEALPMSRISNEARKKITEIVRQDLEIMMQYIDAHTPEITEVEKPKRKSNPKQFDGVKSNEPFVKTRKKNAKKIKHT